MSKFGGVWLYILIIFVALGSAWSAWGAVMSSPSYKVQTDSLNIGGDTENSASYRLRDTAGELSNDVSSSASYKIMAGYRPMQEVYLALSAPGSVSLTPAIGGLTGGTGNGSIRWPLRPVPRRPYSRVPIVLPTTHRLSAVRQILIGRLGRPGPNLVSRPRAVIFRPNTKTTVLMPVTRAAMIRRIAVGIILA